MSNLSCIWRPSRLYSETGDYRGPNNLIVVVMSVLPARLSPCSPALRTAVHPDSGQVVAVKLAGNEPVHCDHT